MSETNGNLQQTYDDARAARKALEKEIAEIDAQIPEAIAGADAEQMIALRARKIELPELYIKASTSERQASEALYRGRFNEAEAIKRKADDEHIAAMIELEELRLRHTAEMRAAEAKVDAAQKRLNVRQGELRQAADDLGASVAGYNRALQALAGVSV